LKILTIQNKHNGIKQKGREGNPTEFSFKVNGLEKVQGTKGVKRSYIIVHTLNIESINVIVNTDFAKSTAIPYSYDVMYMCVARNLKIRGTALSHEATSERTRQRAGRQGDKGG